jgi:diaminopimelate epimerase
MFEPNGEEALCCGNGLACVADLLRRKYRISSSRIMTEIPLTHPRILNIGSASPGQGGWANLGVPRKTPSILANNRNLSAYDEVIDFIELPIQFRQHDLKPYTNATKLSIRAYLVFTGEPHLVVFAEEGFSEPKLASYLFGSLADTTRHPAEQRSNFGNWLVNRVGHHLNVSCRDIFPYGVNVNFARFINPTTAENRCFERGVNKETLACGTGALAVAYVIQKLKPQVSSKITVLPVKCRLQQPEAKMDIQQTQNGWLLNTNPQLLFKGEFQLADPPLLPGSVYPQGADLVTGRQSQARIQRN